MTLKQTQSLRLLIETIELQLSNWNPADIDVDFETFENTVTVTFNKHSELSEIAFGQLMCNAIFANATFDSDTMSFTVQF